ncbi:TonB-dependent receptor [Gluconacetobacter sp. Hr-1-5]|uniref:TonB-dependent receptor n=1 Tax=Gluconacetobacter sp. Hr-1-5 TaxID=3395370 RepID=UPI003B51B026
MKHDVRPRALPFRSDRPVRWGRTTRLSAIACLVSLAYAENPGLAADKSGDIKRKSSYLPVDTRAAVARRQPPKQEETIYVTATRQRTDPQKTPVAVGVVTSSELRKRDLRTLTSLSSSTAGLQIPAPFGNNVPYIFIRGLGTTVPTYSSAVGVYVDDVYQSRTINGGVFGLPDVERIEILRGPQGTLYGQNTSAGAVKIISRTPGNKTTGYLGIAGGTYGQLNGDAYISGPIIKDVLSASLAYAHNENNGYTYNRTLKENVNRTLSDQGRVKIHFTPLRDHGPDFLLSVYYLGDRSDNSEPSPVGVPGSNPRVTYDNVDPRYRNNALLTSFTATQKINTHLTFRAITGFRHFNNSPDPWTVDGVATNTYQWLLNMKQNQFSQEAQIQGHYNRLSFTSGVIDYHEIYDVYRPSVTNNVYAGISSHTTVDSVGFYGQGHYQITSKLGLTLGLRYFTEWDNYRNTGYRYGNSYTRLSTLYNLTGLHQHTNGFTPKGGLDYTFNKKIYGYLSITRGEKSGGFNPVAANAAVATIPVMPEWVTTYEAGFKYTSPDRKYIVNIDGFYNDFSNYQTTLRNAYYNGQIVNGAVAINAESARTYGGEAETVLHPTNDLTIRLNATLLQADFTNFNKKTAVGNVNYTGNALPYTSRWNVGGNVTYTLPLDPKIGAISLMANVRYTSRSYGDIANTVRIPKQVHLDIGAYYTAPGSHWGGYVRADNLINSTYAVGGLPNMLGVSGLAATVYNPPRMIIVGANYSF